MRCQSESLFGFNPPRTTMNMYHPLVVNTKSSFYIWPPSTKLLHATLVNKTTSQKKKKITYSLSSFHPTVNKQILAKSLKFENRILALAKKKKEERKNRYAISFRPKGWKKREKRSDYWKLIRVKLLFFSFSHLYLPSWCIWDKN